MEVQRKMSYLRCLFTSPAVHALIMLSFLCHIGSFAVDVMTMVMCISGFIMPRCNVNLNMFTQEVNK